MVQKQSSLDQWLCDVGQSVVIFGSVVDYDDGVVLGEVLRQVDLGRQLVDTSYQLVQR